MTARRWTYALAAALSGAAWFGLALVFDTDSPDGWAIPRDSILSLLTFLSCGVLAYRTCSGRPSDVAPCSIKTL